MTTVTVISKQGNIEEFDINRIVIALMKSANDTGQPWSNSDIDQIINEVNKLITKKQYKISELHEIAISASKAIRPDVASAYNAYHLYH